MRELLMFASNKMYLFKRTLSKKLSQMKSLQILYKKANELISSKLLPKNAESRVALNLPLTYISKLLTK